MAWLLCESGKEIVTQKNVIDIDSREESNTKHSVKIVEIYGL